MLDFLKTISAKRPTAGDKPPVSVRERVSALRHLPAFLRLIWQTSPALALANVALRLLRAGLPLATLYVARLILDDVVALTRLPAAERVLTPVFTLVALEFGLVLLADALGRGVALLDSLLGDLFANQSPFASWPTPPSSTSTSSRTAPSTTSWSAPAAKPCRAPCS
jgi:ATP-binding cassette subfamily B protein